jgi:hypothetical protein
MMYRWHLNGTLAADSDVRSRFMEETHMTPGLAVPITPIVATLIAGYLMSFAIYNASAIHLAG